ncbi:MAG TPA: DUF488 domain-containing protein [Anaerohalosphaeraceae bacterium]|nr:DUF488 domain-containing protein [Anaerohalosphaeraceae bacterium]HOL89327.1 DUF488 domain-containing protein [Anaerohalosphaeraceae bacterium]HPP56766.1 DUF488 domain-containing protein [Anaerohalosphaeraceae bacterium]
MRDTLFTIGYEGRTLESFLATLKEHCVDSLFDVRELPLSRKKGFSKNALEEYLTRNGIRYFHLPQLGSSRVLRAQLKKTQDYLSFFAAMENTLSAAEETIDLIYRHLHEHVSCLLCFEKSADLCHRSLVAKKIQERNPNRVGICNL